MRAAHLVDCQRDPRQVGRRRDAFAVAQLGGALTQLTALVEQPLTAAQEVGALLHAVELRDLGLYPGVGLADLSPDALDRLLQGVDALVVPQELRLQGLHRVHLG